MASMLRCLLAVGASVFAPGGWGNDSHNHTFGHAVELCGELGTDYSSSKGGWRSELVEVGGSSSEQRDTAVQIRPLGH